jgi:hypothetical protein
MACQYHRTPPLRALHAAQNMNANRFFSSTNLASLITRRPSGASLISKAQDCDKDVHEHDAVITLAMSIAKSSAQHISRGIA